MAVFFLVGAACAGGFPLAGAPLNQFVTFNTSGAVVVAYLWIRMRIDSAIDPGSAPWTIIDEDDVIAPSDAGCSPTPRPEKTADPEAKAKADRATYKNAGTGGKNTIPGS
jgi:hypothetical protein